MVAFLRNLRKRSGKPSISGDLVTAICVGLCIGVAVGLAAGLLMPVIAIRDTADGASTPGLASTGSASREPMPDGSGRGAPTASTALAVENMTALGENGLRWDFLIKKALKSMTFSKGRETREPTLDSPENPHSSNDPAAYDPRLREAYGSVTPWSAASDTSLGQLNEPAEPGRHGSVTAGVPPKSDNVPTSLPKRRRSEGSGDPDDTLTLARRFSQAAIALVEDAVLNGNPIPLMAHLARPEVRATLVKMARSDGFGDFVLSTTQDPKAIALLTQISRSRPLQQRLATLIAAPQIKDLVDSLADTPGVRESCERALRCAGSGIPYTLFTLTTKPN